MPGNNYEAAVAAFIRVRGVTRCPTACALPIQGAVPPGDRAALVVRREAAVAAAVQGGKITFEEACRRYNLSEEEFREWQRAFEAHGLPGLRATRLQQYRTAHSQPRHR